MQLVSQAFHDASQAGIRRHKYNFRASFTRQIDDTIAFAQWDISTWDGGDLWGTNEDNPIQQWDYFTYEDYSDRIIDMEWSREIHFPYSVSSAIADVTLANYDNYFTPNSNSPIAEYNKPKRPIRIYAGYAGFSELQQFVGVTQKGIEIDDVAKEASIHALDWLAEIFNMKLTNVIAMANVTTDVVLKAIFEQFGITPSQYQLAVGRNKIPFVFFEKDKDAGNAIRDLMQAEGGSLWIDEQGIIRFEPRLLLAQPPVMQINPSNIVEISGSGASQIINNILIRTDIRQVQQFQEVYSSTDRETGQSSFIEPLIVSSSGTKFVNIDLKDPMLTAEQPTIGSKVSGSYFTAKRVSNGQSINSGVTITLAQLNTNSYTILFNNANSFPVEIDNVVLWGEPAKLIDELRFPAYESDSVENYGEMPLLEIDNNFFGSESNCESFAYTILDAYKEYNGVIEAEIKGDWALQLNDVIDVQTDDYSGLYKITKSSGRLAKKEASQKIKAVRYNPRDWAVWDVSIWDGGSLWAP